MSEPKKTKTSTKAKKSSKGKKNMSESKKNIIKTVKKAQMASLLDENYKYDLDEADKKINAEINESEDLNEKINSVEIDETKSPEVVENKLLCVQCGNIKLTKKHFYVSYNPLHTKKRIPYCKDCIRALVYDRLGNIVLDKAKKFLQIIDRPFIYDLWDSSFFSSDRDGFGIYMKNLSLPQFRFLSWEHSIFAPTGSVLPMENTGGFELTDEIILRWGVGYETAEYQNFERKYAMLKNHYPERTAMHTEALLNYIRYRVKEEMATAKGDVKEAKEWGGLAQKAGQDAKINPNQLSKADLQDGLNSFAELCKAVEEAVDVVPILPQFKHRPNDSLDFLLWCYVNYVRDIKSLPKCEYKDIYSFYDKKKAEYIDMYGDEFGIFTEDTTENNRKKIEVFVADIEAKDGD